MKKRHLKNIKHFVEKIICCGLSIFRIKNNQFLFIGDGMFNDSIKTFVEYLNSQGFFENNKIIVCVSHPKKNSEQIKFISNSLWSIKKYYFLVTSRFVFYTHGAFTPYRRNGSVYVHMTHSAAQLKATDSPIKNKTSDDYQLVCGFERMNQFLTVENIPFQKLLQYGLPRIDLIFTGNKIDFKTLIPNYQNEKIILAAETFKFAKKEGYIDSLRGDKPYYGINMLQSIDEFKQLDRLLKNNNCYMIIKPHPKQDISKITIDTESSNIIFITSDQLNNLNIEFMELLASSDVLLTDYSSVFYEFLLLDRPIGFLLGDIEEYKRGFIDDNPLKKMPGEKIYNYYELEKFITQVLGNDDQWSAARENIRNSVFKYQDNKNCERLFKWIVEKQEEFIK